MPKNTISANQKINFSDYFNEIKNINFNNLLLFIFIVSVGYYLLEPIYADSKIYDSLANFPQDKIIIKIIFSFTLLYSILTCFWKIFVRKALPTIKSIIYSISFLCVYITVFRIYSNYEFFSYDFIIKFFYFDIITFSAVFLSLEYHSYFKALDFKTENLILME